MIPHSRIVTESEHPAFPSMQNRTQEETAGKRHFKLKISEGRFGFCDKISRPGEVTKLDSVLELEERARVVISRNHEATQIRPIGFH